MNFMPYEVVAKFEKTIAEYCGAKYGVAVDSCTNAIFLSLKFLSLIYDNRYPLHLPRKTYPGVACSIINSGYSIEFTDEYWEGTYLLAPLSVMDSALRFKKGMFFTLDRLTFFCLSFHVKKHIPIGRGGMILTDNKNAAKWFRKARFDGRSQVPLSEDKIDMVGYNMYMTPEQAARGLQLFDLIKDKDLPDIPVESQNYPDLSKIQAYKGAK